MFDLMEGLDPAQAAAVEHGDGPLVIVAGAGTGKTTTLTARVAHQLRRGCRPEELLLLTFTRRAAADMTSRAAALCSDPTAARRIWSGTFHAVAHRLVSEHARALGLHQIVLLDPADVVDLLETMRDEFQLTGTHTRLPSAQSLADICSRAINTGLAARTVIERDFPQYDHVTAEILALLGDFMTTKRRQGLLDFDDLLLAMRALLSDEATGTRIRARWRQVLVDEYQDLNQIQVDIVALLSPAGRGLTVVGDDAQAVYGFRGAHSAHLIDATRRFPGTTVVRLQTNFRSVQPILDLANIVRPAGELAQALTLTAARDSSGAGRAALRMCYDAADQARAVAESVLQAREEGAALHDQAVLMRASDHSRELEIELRIRRIPYVKYGGLRYTDTAHVKDLIAALRITANPQSELSLYRLLKLHRHVGKAHARNLSRMLSASPAGTVLGPGSDPDLDLDLRDPAHRAEAVAAAPAKARLAVAATLDGLAAAIANTEAAQRITGCLDVLRPLVKVAYLDAALRQDDLDRLALAAAASSDLERFLAELILDPAGVSTDFAQPPHIDDDYLVLSTVHSAKGLEWEHVHLIHVTDGAFPSDMALSSPNGLAEEARLFYVAVTRARDRLSLYHPQRLHRDVFKDRHVFTQRSRFLTDEAVAELDVSHHDTATADTGQSGNDPADPARRSADVAARVVIPTMDDLFA
ncbi:ATP-dependent helicase [Jatrophihabitans telluris]|uniref:DNA 3'-5' helicase n=1 Tax=Jatrophihabitans telluris TaxID=2038343 RepID=A0ABY4R0I6_9ACTN|nr:ATP-dependent helicase [Jatrophihabitans telluris]UQX89303.1 ATP-dependent helicase [Jatrophihabitans telluris]